MAAVQKSYGEIDAYRAASIGPQLEDVSNWPPGFTPVLHLFRPTSLIGANILEMQSLSFSCHQ